MGTTYTVTSKVKCWKRHECVGCGCEYRYLFERTVQGQGGTERGAYDNAQKQVIATLEKEVDVRPCPTCGRVQPDMIGQVRAARHAKVAWISIPFFALFILLGALYVLKGDLPSFACAAVALVAAGLNFAFCFNNPNARLKDNAADAKAAVREGLVEIVSPGKPDEAEDPPSPTGPPHYLGVLAGLAAAVVISAPVVNRAFSGLPVNVGLEPYVVSAGDETKMWYPDTIDCVSNNWRGGPTVTVLNPADFGNRPPLVTGTGSTSVWSNSMNVKRSQMHTTSTLWAKLKFPADDRLAGQTLKLRVDLNVEFPQADTSNSFRTQTRTVSKTLDVTFAANGAGAKYNTVWWVGLLVGSLLSVSASFFMRSLAKELQRHAIPTDIESVKDDDDDDDDKNDDDRPRRKRRDD